MKGPHQRFWVAATLVCYGAAGHVYAQGADQAEGSGEQSGSGLAEIVVTAQRRKENLERVPITVAAFDADAIANANITSAADISKLTPSIMLGTADGTVTPFLRGVGTPIDTVGNEASVALYVDGIYYARTDPGLFLLNNIDHIEVVSGPQGTLFGRNASAGVVQIVTRDPVPGADPMVRGSVGLSNYETGDVTLYATHSIGDRMAADLAIVYHNQLLGWGVSVYDGSQAYLGKDFVARSKFVADLGDATKLTATLDYEASYNTIDQPNHFFNNPQGYPDGSGKLPTVGFYDQDHNYLSRDIPSDEGVSVRLVHDFGTATLTDIASFRYVDELDGIDGDASPLNYASDALFSIAHQVSNELRVNSTGKGAFQYTAGFFYLDQLAEYEPFQIWGVGIGPPGTEVAIYGSAKSSSYAPFAQATLQVLPKLSVTIGGRYSVDHMSGYGYTAGSFNTAPTYTTPRVTASNSFEKANYRFALDYQIASDVLLYASTSTGYKAATYNTLPFSPMPALPETLTAYEVGIKSEAFEHRLRVNASAFYYRLHDVQVQIATSYGGSLANAPAAKDKGFDLDTALRVTSNLTARVAVSFLDAYYTDYPNAPVQYLNPNPPYGDTAPVPGNVDGNTLPFAPRWTVSAGADYKIASSVGDWTAAANYYHNSGIVFNPDNRARQPAYDLLDANLVFAPQGSHLKYRAYVSNLANTKYYVKMAELAGNAGDEAYPGAPRTYGAAVMFSF